MLARHLLPAPALLLLACTAEVDLPPGEFVPEADADVDEGISPQIEASELNSEGWGELPYDDDPGDDPDADPHGDLPIDPWALNVVSMGDIGSADEPYQSDYEGAAAALGDVYFTSFSLNAVCGEDTPASLFAGGDLQLTGAIEDGGAEVGGDVNILGASVSGDIWSGGDLDGSAGSISGDVSLAGEKLVGKTVTVQGTLTEHCPYAPVLDLDALADFFHEASASIAALQPTCAATETWGELVIELSGDVNVVELSAAELEDAWGVTISGPEGAELYLNLPDEALSLDGMVWTYLEGASAEATLLNLPQATSLDIVQGDHHVNILAPKAETVFPSGLVTGNLVVASMAGGGQVNCGHFGGSMFPR